MSIKQYLVTCLLEIEVDDENLEYEPFATVDGVQEEFDSWLSDLDFRGSISVVTNDDDEVTEQELELQHLQRTGG